MKPKHQCPFSPEYLREYSMDHLWYEVWMFFQTGTVLPGGVYSPKIEFVDNAILESFAIHLRNLLDFFYPHERPKPDDVIAAYYFDTGTLPSNCPGKSQLLNDAETRAHKQVSHLTSKRYTGNHPEKQWYTRPLMREVAELLMFFIETASPDRLPREFIEQTRAFLAQLSPVVSDVLSSGG